MKTSLSLLFVAVVVIAAFLMGRGNSGAKSGAVTPEANTRTTSSQTVAAASAKPKMKIRTGPDVLSPENAAKLSSPERIALLKKAAVLADPEKQADILCGLLSVMNEEELNEATRTLLDAQRKGNAWSQEVWNTLWTQWGRVNAVNCLALSKTGKPYPGWNGLNGLNTPNDYRCLMAGWLDAHPQEAMAWAREPKDNLREATGAAFAITSSADGDLEKMEAAILSISGDEQTTQACFRDYFDLATSTGDKPSPGEVYEQLDPKLRAAAWPEAMERLLYGDLDAASAWFEKHATDPGYEEGVSTGLIIKLAEKNAAATAQWAAKLPIANPNPDSDIQHPAVVAINMWLSQDPVAAKAWIQKQPADTPWLSKLRTRMDSPAPETIIYQDSE